MKRSFLNENSEVFTLQQIGSKIAEKKCLPVRNKVMELKILFPIF